MAFKKYHLEHHMFQGHDAVDTDIPTRGEAKMFTMGGALLKVVWVIGQLFFYAIRPLFVRPKPMGKWDFLNLLSQLTFDLAYIKFAGPRAFTYLLASVFLGGGLHPIAGHFISEHYVFEPGQETYSYYGPSTRLCTTWGTTTSTTTSQGAGQQAAQDPRDRAGVLQQPQVPHQLDQGDCGLHPRSVHGALLSHHVKRSSERGDTRRERAILSPRARVRGDIHRIY